MIPLVKLDANPFYREVSRASLHIKHLVLCHASWSKRVESFLEEHARPGFALLSGKEWLTASPQEWCVYTGVELMDSPNVEVNKDLECLVPLAEGVNIQCSGGLQLAPSIWHSRAPPEIFCIR